MILLRCVPLLILCAGLAAQQLSSPPAVVTTLAGSTINGTPSLTGQTLVFNEATMQWDISIPSGSGDMVAANNLGDVPDPAEARANLGLEIGGDVQAFSAVLATYASINPSADIQELLAAADYTALLALLNLEAGVDFYSVAAADAAFQPIDDDLSDISGLVCELDEIIKMGAMGWGCGTDSGAGGGISSLSEDPDPTLSADLDLNGNVITGMVIGTNIQAQDPELDALAALTSAADALPYFTGSGTASVTTLSSYMRGILDDANEATFKASVNLEPGIDVQAFDPDLSALASNSSNGLWSRTGSGTGSARTITAPAAGITVTNGDGVAGNPTLALANDLAALEGLGSNGCAARTGTSTWNVRTVTGTSNEISVTNGDCVAGNPTLALASTIDLGGKTSFEIPNGAAPTVDAFGEIAGDNNLWATGRGAALFYDGTAVTALIGVLASDTPVNGQTLKYNDGVITWENDADSGGGGGDLGDSTFDSLTSNGTNPASAGIARAANNEALCWRNAGNDGNICLKVNASDEFEFDAAGNFGGTPQAALFTAVTSPSAPGSANQWLFYQDSADGFLKYISNGGSEQEIFTTANLPTAAEIDDGGATATFAMFSGAGGAASFRAIADGDIPAGITRTIASGTKALDTDAIASGACDTLSTTTATGVASTDVIWVTPNADISGVTGYSTVTTGGLRIWWWPTTNTINWKVCNPTESSVTPGAVTLNYRVVR